MTDNGWGGYIRVPDDMRGFYLPGHRFWTDGTGTGPLKIECHCGFTTEGSAERCIEAAADHVRDALNRTRLFQREIILRGGAAIAVWAYDPEPGSWAVTTALATALAEFAESWAHTEERQRQPSAPGTERS